MKFATDELLELKWVRTKCGRVGKGKLFSDETQVMFIINGNDEYYYVKKQGNNLIDLLENKDIVILSFGQVSTFKDYIYMGGFTSEDLHIYNVIKIITHEQYMTHTQDIKEEEV